MAIKLANDAIDRLLEVASMCQSENPMFRIGIVIDGSGCSGMKYYVEYTEEKRHDDNQYLFYNNLSDELTILIDKHSDSIIGYADIDWVETDTDSGFVFRRPSSCESCDCDQDSDE